MGQGLVQSHTTRQGGIRYDPTSGSWLGVLTFTLSGLIFLCTCLSGASSESGTMGSGFLPTGLGPVGGGSEKKPGKSSVRNNSTLTGVRAPSGKHGQGLALAIDE